MLEKLGLLPVAASTHAGRVDALYFFLVALSLSLQAVINAVEKRFLRWRPELEVR